MIAKARAISHGSSYTTYSTLKKDAEFVCSLNMDCDTVLSLDPAEDAWEEFKNQDQVHHNRIWNERKNDPTFSMPKREVTNTMFAMEVSPSIEESKGWTLQDWQNFGVDFIRHLDDIELTDKNGKVSSKKTNLKNSKVLMMLHHDSKSGIPHLHIMASRFDNDGFVNCANLIGMKATIAANQMNRERGWKQSRDISAEHKAELKDACYSVLKSMSYWNQHEYFDRLIKAGIKFEMGAGNKSYKLFWGNSSYKASEVGQHLTIGKLPKEWERVHQIEIDALADRLRVIKQQNEAKPEIKSPVTHREEPVIKPTVPMITTTSIDDDGHEKKATFPRHIFDIIKQHTSVPEEADYENEVNGIPIIPEINEAIGMAVSIMFDLLTLQGVVPAGGGGGGGGSTGGWRDKDDDEWRRAAAKAGIMASAKCTPAHSRRKSRGFRR